ncbi:MAG: TRAP transporter small permease [Pseudomonadota bacterium]|nr:TRAP transporter small permease [Pseudomonadota bacterium]
MGFLNSCDRMLGALILSSNAIASVWVFLMMFGVVIDVLGRFLFNTPMVGTAEMVTISIVSILYLQLAYTLRSGSMTRSDAVITRLIKNRPRAGHALDLLFCVAGLFLMVSIMSAAWPKSLDAYQNDFYVGVVGVFTFPDWPRLFLVFLGCGLTGLQFLLIGVKDLVTIVKPNPAA